MTCNREKMMLEMVHDRVVAGGTRVVCTAAVLQCGKQMENLPDDYFSWIVSSRREKNVTRFLWRQNNLEVNYFPFKSPGAVFIEETPHDGSNSEDYIQEQKKHKEHHSFKTGTWNVMDLESRRKTKKTEEHAEEHTVCARCY
jgi:hypothetical protein